MSDQAQAARDKAWADKVAAAKKANAVAKTAREIQAKKDRDAAAKKKNIDEQTRIINAAKEAIKSINTSPDGLYQQQSDLSQKNRELSDYLVAHPGAGPSDSGLISIRRDLDDIQRKINGYNARKASQNSIIAAAQTKIKDINKPKKPTPHSTPANVVSKVKSKPKDFSTTYKYNAPMVADAYISSNSIQAAALDNNFVTGGSYDDARKAWQGVQGGKGTIQMNKDYVAALSTSTGYSSKIAEGSQLDYQLYGFKFLYNPTNVAMAWGIQNAMDPPFEASGQDQFSPIASGLMTSTIRFDLMLNRIEDFNHVNPDGSYRFSSDPFADFAMSSASLMQDLSTALGSTTKVDNAPPSPYPTDVLVEDRREIIDKGTMYDLEYLFKVINGPSATFHSPLQNSLTADKGWLQQTFVELHLGSRMRYVVRVTDLQVNHIMFTPKMVPVWSVVSMTCTRLNDSTVGYTKTSTPTAGK